MLVRLWLMRVTSGGITRSDDAQKQPMPYPELQAVLAGHPRKGAACLREPQDETPTMTKLPLNRASTHVYRRHLTEEDRQTDRVWRKRWWLINSVIIATLCAIAFVSGGREDRQPPNLAKSTNHEAMPGSTNLSWTVVATPR